MKKTISDLIDESGGAGAIAMASQRTKHPITRFAVYKWIKRNCIPSEYWGLIMRLSGASLEAVWQANQETPRPRSPRAALAAA